jgi:hypothetical protein
VKVLFLMDSPEYLRFYDTAVEELAARGHVVAIGVNSQRSKKPVGVEGLQAYADRVTVLGVVPVRTGFWAEAGHGVRALMDFVRFLHPDFAGARALRLRMKRKVVPRAWRWLDAIPKLSPGTVRAAIRVLAAVERAIPVHAPIADYLRVQAPDVLLVSPLVTSASEQVEWVKAAAACGIRTVVCVASWDNLTNKGLLRVQPDRVFVWNEAQKGEAVAFHYIPEDKVVVTGAQLFDKWFGRAVTHERDAFCQRVGLRDTRPFILFTGSSSFISETGAEVAFVRRWVQALRASGDPALAAANILVRPHPYNFHLWAGSPVSDLPGVAVYPRQGYNPIAPENRSDFYDSLYHSAVVVGVNTSAMVEAAIVGRPVCSLLAPEFAGTQEGTIHFRHLLPENGGFLRIAATVDEHVQQVSDCLRNPAATRAETGRFVASFIRPAGVETPATPIFVDAVERAASLPAPAPAAVPAWRVLVWPPLALATAIAVSVDAALAPDALVNLRKRVKGQAKPLAKWWHKRRARVKRDIDRAW